MERAVSLSCLPIKGGQMPLFPPPPLHHHHHCLDFLFKSTALIYAVVMSTIVMATTMKKHIGERERSSLEKLIYKKKWKKKKNLKEILWILFHFGLLLGLVHKIMVA